MDGDDSFKPSAKSVRSIVDAWIKSTDPEALDKAEAFLERYEDMEYLSDPENKSVLKDIYKSLLFGLCRGDKPERAHEFLMDMVDQDLDADSFCFDKVIESYTNTEDGAHKLNRVKEVFELMEHASESGGVQPNERVYTSFIRALTKAEIPDLLKEATAILERMKSEYAGGNRNLKPTVFTYNAVLKACATEVSEDQATNMETFKSALSIFNELRAAKEQPDHVTFGNMLRCAALLPQGSQREAMITTTFQLCCRNGFLNSFVIRDLQFAAEEELWRDLCSCPAGEVDLDRLPQAWIKKFEKKEKRPPARGRKRF
jgi:pentatricopeptide repeat protein